MSTLSTSAGAASRLEIDDLRELLSEVNLTTNRLQSTHLALQQQVARLQQELAEANAQLQRSRSLAALGEMAAGIAHEVRNPLGSIRLYVQMLAEDLVELPQSAAVCEKIGRAVSGLDAVVRDVLMFARDRRVRPSSTSASELFDRALLVCEDLIRESAARIERTGVDACTLQADVSLMSQALSNLLRNALQAMQECQGERRLILGASRRSIRYPDGRRAPAVVLSVGDTGPGIPEEALSRMFNPFFTTRPSGTGLGLAIVHRIVDAHGGHLRVQNLPQAGACLEVCLPLESPADDGDRPAIGSGAVDQGVTRKVCS